MSKQNESLSELLKRDGAEMVRNKKHQIWRLSNGKTLTISNSPGTKNTDKMNIRLFHKLLKFN